MMLSLEDMTPQLYVLQLMDDMRYSELLKKPLDHYIVRWFSKEHIVINALPPHLFPNQRTLYDINWTYLAINLEIGYDEL